MTRFVVMEPPSGNADPVFVRDRFSWLGFFFPPFWLLFHRLWLATGLYVAAIVALSFFGSYAGAPASMQLALAAVGVLVALEGPAWRIAKLRRAGYREASAINAESIDEADLIFAETGFPQRPAALSASAMRRTHRHVRTLLDPIGP